MDSKKPSVNKRNKKLIPAVDAPHSFDDLPDDIAIDILCRLPTKQLPKLASVSKSWFRLITAYCFPKSMTSSDHDHQLPYLGLLFRVETASQHARVTFCNTDSMRVHCFGSAQIPNSCSKTLPFNVSAKSFVDCCNGLLLFCRRSSTADRLYHYYVLNSLTKQLVTVPKPGRTSLNAYAALAYDPSESSYFKLVRFQGLRCLNVYRSETKTWRSFKFQLQNDVVKAKWSEQSIYYKGAIYRLSMSGHLIRFVVDDLEEAMDVNVRARAIDLPEIAKVSPKGCLGLNEDSIHFSVYRKPDLWIWVLEINNKGWCGNRNDYVFEWTLKCRFSCTRIPVLENKYCIAPLAFHPDSDLFYVGTSSQWGSSLFCLKPTNEGRPREYHRVISYVHGHLNWNGVFAYPFLQCSLPFATGLAIDQPEGDSS